MAGPLRALAKWIGVPIALGAVGYFVIGPRVGTPPDKAPKQVQDIVATVESHVNPHAAVTPPVTEQGTVAPTQNSAPEPSKHQTPGATSPKPASGTSSTAATSDGPQVEVSVDGASTDRPVTHHSTHHRKSKPATPKKPKQGEDGGSFGGTKDAGKSPPPAAGN